MVFQTKEENNILLTKISKSSMVRQILINLFNLGTEANLHQSQLKLIEYKQLFIKVQNHMNHLCFVCERQATKVCIHQKCDSNPFLCNDQCRDGKNMAIKIHKHDGNINIIQYQDMIKKVSQVQDGGVLEYMNKVKKRVQILKGDLDIMLKKLQSSLWQSTVEFSPKAKKALNIILNGTDGNGLQGKDVRQLIEVNTSEIAKPIKKLYEDRLKAAQLQIHFLLQCNKDQAKKYYQKGFKLQSNNRFQLAIKEYLTSFRLNSMDPSPLYQIAVCYYSLQNFSESMKFNKKYLELAPVGHLNMAKSLNSVGNIYYHHCNDNLKALKYYNKAICANNQEASYYNNRGSSFANLEKSEQAIKDFTTAIEINASKVYYKNRSRVLRKLGRILEAQKDDRTAQKMTF